MRREAVRLGLELLALLSTLQKQGHFSLFSMNDSHLPQLEKMMIQYADFPIDLADASLVLLAENLGHGCIVSTDQRDFRTYRWKNHHPFHNLLAVD